MTLSARPLRVGLLIYGSLSTLSGGYLYDRKLVEHLKRQGRQVEIISLPWRSYARCLTDNFSLALHRRLRQAELDILLQDELNHPSLFLLNQRLKGHLRYPVLTIVHHLRSSEYRPAWLNQFYRLVERRFLDSVQGFIFNSQTTQQTVAQCGVDLQVQPWVIAQPAGDRFSPDIDENTIQLRAHQSGALRLLFVGNLIPRKGLHTLLSALQRLPDLEWSLQVVGSSQVDQAYTRRILGQIAAAGLDARVHLHGPLTDEPLADLFRSSHLLVVPSSYEGFGIVYLEGMSFGLPAIAGAAGATGEIIDHGRNGFLVAPEDSVGLADLLIHLAQDRKELANLSLAAWQSYRLHPTWEESMSRIDAFLVERIKWFSLYRGEISG